jgi:DNA-binding NarL/FixJ family response regulator
MTIRAIIADDQEVVRRGIALIVSGTEIEIIAEARTAIEAIELARLPSDVLVLDLRLPDMDGLRALMRIREESPATRVLMMSAFDNPTHIARSHALGACGYLSKSAKREQILTAIRSVAAGGTAWAEGDLRQLTSNSALRNSATFEAALTRRESEVLQQLALGLQNKEIAKALHISNDTAKEHVQRVFRKLGVCDRTQAAVWAVRHGFD